ncbi:MAG: hypothetical protein AB7O24_08175 [Kofleriaceae bacterium]
MNKIVLAFVTALALLSFGCKKKGDGGGSDEALKKLTTYKDAVCACKDVACVTSASEAYAKANAATPAKADAKPDPDLVAKMAPINKEITDCTTKITSAAAAAPAAGSADPAAAGSADPAAAGSADPAAAGSADPAAAGSAAAGSAAGSAAK